MKTLIYILFAVVCALAVPPAEALFLDKTAALGPGAIANRASAWVDYDSDGWVDLHDGVTLWRNQGGAGFTAVTTVSSGNSLWADFDNDGFLDVYSGIGVLHRNVDGTGAFAPQSFPALPMTVSQASSWGDHDGDGFVDIYITGYEGGPLNDAHVRNDGGVFSSVVAQSYNLRQSRGVTSCDFDQDGDIDVYVSNYRLQPNSLWLNDGNGGFDDFASTFGVQGTGGSAHTIGSAWGDLDNDGYIDLFVGNFAHPGQPQSQFLRNMGPSGSYHFTDMSATAGLHYQESYATPALGDMDNDGDLDLFLTAVYPGDNAVLYRNDGNWAFTDVTSAMGLGGLPGDNYQAAWADYDNDGDLDLVSHGTIWENQGNANHWLKVALVGNGMAVNRAAIGAQVRIRKGAYVVTRQVEGSTGEGNENDLTLHFGLGTDASPVDLEVRWPNGATRLVRGLAVDRTVTIRAIEGTLTAIGAPSPANGWDTTSEVSIRAFSSQKATRPWSTTIDGSGILDAEGFRHSTVVVPTSDMALNSGPDVQAVRGGTVAGDTWVEFDLGDRKTLTEMWIWNYNEGAWTRMGMKEVTIEVSDTGGTNPSEWQTVFDGRIPEATGTSGAWPSLMLPMADTVAARYVVITTDAGMDRNWANGSHPDCGLSEVRFFTLPLLGLARLNIESCRFQTANDVEYSLQRAPAGQPGATWVDTGLVIVGDGTVRDAIDPLGPSAQFVYRVVHAGAVGNPNAGNGWDSTGAVSVRAGLEHSSRPWINTINGSGIHGADGEFHTDCVEADCLGNGGPATMGFAVNGPAAARGGTVSGSQWVEYAFDRVYHLANLMIWNYNEDTNPDTGSGSNNWSTQGMKDVTIQYTTVAGTGAFAGWGSGNPTDWLTAFSGSLNKASGSNMLQAQLIVVNGAAKYVVITAADNPDGNFMNDFNQSTTSTEAALSEVRFDGLTVEPYTGTVHPQGLAFRFPTAAGKRYGLQRTTDLVSPVWETFDMYLWGDGSEMMLYDIPGAADGATYRVVSD